MRLFSKLALSIPKPSITLSTTRTIPRTFGLKQFSTTTPYTAKFKLQKKKNAKVEMTDATTLKGQALDRPTLDSLLRRRLFYTPSFEIYNGVAGLFDYGPPGCALQANIIEVWRKHFVLEEDMLELDCTALTPHEVLKTSGHVDKFSDWMCKDPKNGEIIRADHFVEEVLSKRLKADKEARGVKTEEAVVDPAKKKRKVKDIAAMKLEDSVVQEYEEILAKVCTSDSNLFNSKTNKLPRLTTTTAPSSASSSQSTSSPTQTLASCQNHLSSLTSCSRPLLVHLVSCQVTCAQKPPRVSS